MPMRTVVIPKVPYRGGGDWIEAFCAICLIYTRWVSLVIYELPAFSRGTHRATGLRPLAAAHSLMILRSGDYRDTHSRISRFSPLLTGGFATVLLREAFLPQVLLHSAVQNPESPVLVGGDCAGCSSQARGLACAFFVIPTLALLAIRIRGEPCRYCLLALYVRSILSQANYSRHILVCVCVCGYRTCIYSAIPIR